MSIKLHFIGTGAADHKWDQIGTEGVRGSSSLLVNDHILIDCGVTAEINLRRFGVNTAALTDLLISHTHIDHFDPKAIRDLLAGRPAEVDKLCIHCSPEGVEILQQELADLSNYTLSPVKTADKITIGDTIITALPSNHLIASRPDETTFWYLLETAGGNLLYALDGAWTTARARSLMTGKMVDWMIWDATTHLAGNWRTFEHNDLTMIKMQIVAMLEQKSITPQTVHILNHFARTLWPADDEIRRILDAEGLVMAYDDLKLDLPQLVTNQ